MTNALIAFDNLLNAATSTISASTEATGYEKENLFDGIEVDYWKPTAVPAWVKASGRMPLGMWMGDTTAETLTSGTDADLTPYSNNLSVSGTGLVKSAVASAALLMGYSNWSAANNLDMVYNSLFDFGVADWSWSGWVKQSTAGVAQIIFSRGYYSGGWSGSAIRMYVDISGYVVGAITDDSDTTFDTITSGVKINDGEWHYVTFQRNNTVLELFIDAAKVAADVTITYAVASLSNASATLLFGLNQAGGLPGTYNTLALWRVYGVRQTPAQILADMNAESHWFDANGTLPSNLLSVAATTADYFAMYAHDMAQTGASVVLQYSDDDSTWTNAFDPIFPSSEKPILKSFTQSSHEYWRLYLDGAVQQIGVTMFGTVLEMQRGLSVGYKAFTMGSENKAINSESNSGNFIGKSVIKEPVTASLDFEYITPGWLRQYWPTMIATLDTSPFFVVPHPTDYPDEVGYCWLQGGVNEPEYMEENHVGFSVPIKARIA